MYGPPIQWLQLVVCCTVKCRQCKTVVKVLCSQKTETYAFFTVISIQLLFDNSLYQAHNYDFAKEGCVRGLSQRLKFFISKNTQLSDMLSKLMQLKRITDKGLGSKSPAAGRFLQFFVKNNLTI